MARIFDSGGLDPGPGGVGGGGGTSSGGGTVSSGQAVPVNLSGLTSSGGLHGGVYLLCIPVQDFQGNSYLAYLDLLDFDTEEDCYYKYRVEDLQPARYVTIKLVQIIYRNLGKVKINVRIEGLNEKNELDSISKDFDIGDVSANNKLYELMATLEITLKRPQITITRNANKGPLSIVKTTMMGVMGEGPSL